MDYFPFGSLRVDERYSNFDETKKFTGHELDDESNLYYAKARYYDPEIGRFISQDPLQWRPGELQKNYLGTSQFLNFYSYSLNNPIRLVDPTGDVPVESAVDVIAVTLSAIAYNQNPSIGNAAWLALDGAGAVLPYVPSAVGYIRHSKQAMSVVKYFDDVSGRTGLGVMNVAYEFAKNSTFRFTERAWSIGKAGDSVASLTGHYLLHGKEFGAKSVDDYYKMANKFIDSGNNTKFSQGADTLYYNMKTNELAITDSGGAIRSYYKMDLKTAGKDFEKSLRTFKRTVGDMIKSISNTK